MQAQEDCHWTFEKTWLEARGVEVTPDVEYRPCFCFRLCPQYYQRLDAQQTALYDTVKGDHFIPKAFVYLEFEQVAMSDIVFWRVGPCTRNTGRLRPRNKPVYFKSPAFATQQQEEAPKTVTLQRTETSLVLSRKWCINREDVLGRMFWPTLILCGFIAGSVFNDDPLLLRVLTMLYALVWIWLLVIYTQNSTLITIQDGRMTVQNGPYRLKWWHKATFDLDNIRDVLCARNIGKRWEEGGGDNTYYETFGVHIIDLEGNHRRVIGHLYSKEEALCILQAIETEKNDLLLDEAGQQELEIV